ncbi:uncharacterized protein F4822DRAFT_49224 [Hypoxylon trugodes]|uniref:uncharacterized protein n=1 Tax=Hypoxylon trugodes TaxID=326681 RepID=UPI002191F0BA|nr:uncharacterized protein F4822DRAFT_49224 [Hypoxylon trugodes]KAI1383746.1 hypothetical protein F4822DRAFT_49224 [Hypoxylon trugodes]
MSSSSSSSSSSSQDPLELPPIPHVLPNTVPGYYDPEVFPDEPVRPDPQRPLSPYSQKYGISDIPFWRRYHPDGQAHSSLAPLYPDDRTIALPPTGAHRSERVRPLDELPQPTNQGLDELFYSEMGQKSGILPGFKTWQTPAFDLDLYDKPPTLSNTWGHGKLYEIYRWDEWLDYTKKFVKVDESKWLPCFQKDRWFDLRTNPLNSLINPVPGFAESNPMTWSVDNEMIWDIVKIQLEVVNRILLRLIHTQSEWLDALLFGERIYLRNEPRFQQWGDDVAKKIWRFRSRPLEERAKGPELLNEVRFRSYDIYCSFFDETQMSREEDTLGVTRPNLPGFDDHVKMLHVEVAHNYRPLLELHATPADRTRAMWVCIETIIHEFGHAVNDLRSLRVFPDKGNPYFMNEPFYNDEWIPELGASFGNTVWNGFGRWYPSNNTGFLRGGRKTGLLTHSTVTNYPTVVGYHHASLEHDPEGLEKASRYTPEYLVPTIWMSSLLCEKFWAEVVNKHGTTAFLMPRLIIIPQVAPGISGYADARVMETPEIHVPESTESLKQVARQFVERSQLWQSMRQPWYQREYKNWKQLPWSNMWTRNCIDQFSYFHAQRDLYNCREVAYRMWGHVDAFDNRPGEPRDPVMVLQRSIFELMMISMPITPDFGHQEYVSKMTRYYSHWPSLEARAPFNARRGIDPNEDRALGPSNSGEDHDLYRSLPYPFKNYGDYLDTTREALICHEFETGGPRTWLEPVIHCLVELTREREQDMRLNTWASFTFTVPPYEPGWVFAGEKEQSLSVNGHARYQAIVPWQEGLPYWPDDPESAGDVGQLAKDLKMVDISDEEEPHTTYYHIGTVANHRSLHDAWIVQQDNENGIGFDVFDITDVLQKLGAKGEHYRECVEIGPYGPTLRDGAAAAGVVRSHLQLNNIQPIGKLILLRRAEEVAECNGKDGRLSWTTWGTRIYNITNFTPESPNERKALRESAGRPLSGPLQRMSNMSRLLARLEPFTVARLETPPPQGRTMRPFTPRILRWYDNPSLGLYMAVDNKVFDVSNYMLFHPGGTQLLRGCLGRNASTEFEQYHNFDLLQSYEHLQVGHLVPEIEMEQMSSHHVLVHQWIFDISSLQNDNPYIYDILIQCTAKDTNTFIRGIDKPIGGTKAAGEYANALGILYNQYKPLIVAGLAPDVPLIPQGEFIKHNNPSKTAGAFILIGGEWVYNVTHIMRHPGYFEHKIDRFLAGKELKDPAIASWLEQNFKARCVGKLSPGPAWTFPDRVD